MKLYQEQDKGRYAASARLQGMKDTDPHFSVPEDVTPEYKRLKEQQRKIENRLIIIEKEMKTLMGLKPQKVGMEIVL